MPSDFPRYDYDDDLIAATCADDVPRVRVYRLSGMLIVLGAGSRPDVELHRDACHADAMPIVRRRGGGCAVVIDPGNLIVSLVMTGIPFGGYRRHFDVLSAWLTNGLARAGIEGLRKKGICDLVRGDRKVAGACLHRSKGLLYYSATLLVSPDIAAMTRYLKHPPREPDYRRRRDHANFLGRLDEGLCVLETEKTPEARRGGAMAELLASRLRVVLEPPDLLGAVVDPRM